MTDEITDENYCDWRQSDCPWVKDLRARIAELEAALKPFVWQDKTLFEELFGSYNDSATGQVTVKLGDLRAARAAYLGEKEPAPPNPS